MTTTESTWDRHYATSRGYRYWPNEELVRWVAGRNLGLVLEVGCGNGANLWFLAEHADLVYGADTSAQAAKAAEDYMAVRSADVLLRNGDIRELPFAMDCADTLIDCMTSQHIPWADHEQAYREYARVLKPGGRMFLYHLDALTRCEREKRNPHDVDCEQIALFPEAGLTCLPWRASLVNVVSAAGLTVTGHYGLTREYPNSPHVASYSIVEARR